MSVWRWRVEVEAPGDLTEDQRDSLFTAVADAAHAWEEAQCERGWDAPVSARMERSAP